MKNYSKEIEALNKSAEEYVPGVETDILKAFCILLEILNENRKD